MSLCLYCKEIPVYDIENEKVLSFNLLPGIMRGCACNSSFTKWKRARYSSNTNAYARAFKGVEFGQRNRDRIDITTRSFSLSDCYWVKDSDEDISFSELTPYLNDFWFDSKEPYHGGAVPTLYTNGFLNKEWTDKDILVKQSNKNEFDCLSVLNQLPEVSCEEVVSFKENLLAVRNFTNLDVFFESAEMSGKIDGENFSLEEEIQIAGVDTPIIDAIVGNGDRHAGNFGFLRSTLDGSYVSSAPIFDFDHALDVQSAGLDILMQDGIAAGKLNLGRVHHLCEAFIQLSENAVFKQRAKFLIEYNKVRNFVKV